MGMRVPDVADVVDTVQVLIAELVVHVLSLGPDELDRVRPVEELAALSHVLLPEADGLSQRNLLGGGDHGPPVRTICHGVAEFKSCEKIWRKHDCFVKERI